MNLDNKALYKLTKIGIKNGESRMVNLNDTHVGQALVDSLSNRLMVGNLITSTIVNIKDQENGNYMVETKNSIYSLEKLTDEVT